MILLVTACFLTIFLHILFYTLFSISLSCCLEIIERIRIGPTTVLPAFRPDVSYLDECPSQCPDYVIELMQEAWSELPEQRPNFRSIRERLKPLKEGM